MSAFFTWVAQSGVVQGVIMGLTFAYLTTILVLNAVARAETTTVNGWSAIRRAGRPGNGILVRAALQKALPVVNVFEEAAYWTTARDEKGARLGGGNTYRMHFPAGQLPPNDAFWSLTATDTAGYQTRISSGRSSVDSHSGLVTNPDGSVDIVLRADPPADAAPNWLATPKGRFKLMLRAYLPGASVVNGDYEVPPIVEVRS
ncbi:DUF1214 domain-containing protein [Rathayibacter sp. CAU 1779]